MLVGTATLRQFRGDILATGEYVQPVSLRTAERREARAGASYLICLMVALPQNSCLTKILTRVQKGNSYV